MTDQLEMTFATAESVCELVYGDPAHAAERQAVIEAIATVARRDGNTDPNRVRPHIPSWVAPQVIGSTWNALRNRGLLVPIGWTTNEDKKGRNSGKPQRIYEVRGDLVTSSVATVKEGAIGCHGNYLWGHRMSTNRAKGTKAESALVGFLRTHGWPFAERRALAGSKDRGDVTGTPFLCWEQKSAARICLPEWLRETEAERINAGANYGVLVVKLKGFGDLRVGEWAAVMPLRQMTDLLHAAGYGDAPTKQESA